MRGNVHVRFGGRGQRNGVGKPATALCLDPTESLTISFADDGEIPRGFVDIGNFNLDGLPQTRAAGIHHLQAAAIDRTMDRMDQLQAVGVIQDLGQTELR